MIPRVPHVWRSEPFPYDEFEGTPIDPLASHEQVLNGALALQQLNRFPPNLRRAWDRLRVPDERLATEFFLIRPELCRPDEFLADALADFLEQVR